MHTPFMRWRDRTFPEQRTWFAEGLVWGFAEMTLAGDALTVTIVTTPATGSGETVMDYRQTFDGR